VQLVDIVAERAPPSSDGLPLSESLQ